jgi:hypothetical protein
MAITTAGTHRFVADDRGTLQLEPLPTWWQTDDQAELFRGDNDRAEEALLRALDRDDTTPRQEVRDEAGTAEEIAQRALVALRQRVGNRITLREHPQGPVVDGHIQVKTPGRFADEAERQRYNALSQTVNNRFGVVAGAGANQQRSALSLAMGSEVPGELYEKARIHCWLDHRGQLNKQGIRRAEDFFRHDINSMRDYAGYLHDQGKTRQLQLGWNVFAWVCRDSLPCSIVRWTLVLGIALAVLIPSVQTLMHRMGGSNPMKASFGYLSPKDATVFASISGGLAGVAMMAIAYRSYQIHKVYHSQPDFDGVASTLDQVDPAVGADMAIADVLPSRETLRSLGIHSWQRESNTSLRGVATAFIALGLLSALIAMTRPWNQGSSILTSGRGCVIALSAGLGAGAFVAMLPGFGGRQSFYQKFSDSYDRLHWAAKALVSVITLVGTGLLLGYAPAVGGGLLSGLLAHHLVHRIKQNRGEFPGRPPSDLVHKSAALAGCPTVEAAQTTLADRQAEELREDIKCALAWTGVLAITATVLYILAKQVKLPALDKRNIQVWLDARRHLNHLNIFAALAMAGAGASLISALAKGLERRSRLHAVAHATSAAPHAGGGGDLWSLDDILGTDGQATPAEGSDDGALLPLPV